MVTKLKTYVSPWHVLRRWPEKMPVCFFGGSSSRYSILATSFSEVSLSEFLEKPLRANPSKSNPDLPFQKGYVGLLSYDDYSNGQSSSRIFRVSSGLIFDEKKRELFKSSNTKEEHTLSDEELSKILETPPVKKSFPWKARLTASRQDADYLSMTKSAIEEIRNGRFYQINLLRYFKVENAPTKDQLISKMEQYSGPQAVWFKHPGLEVVSFSPERFIETNVEETELHALTQPIKGTSPRCQDQKEDKLSANSLVSSRKDNAELHMIVDLMRNDLNRVSHPQTVKVTDKGSLHSFSNVHHLIASITSKLRDQTIGEFFSAVCPGGSITGAPKLEVMKAIAQYEGRDRGFFMGNAFYLDDSGRFDSSILIRTLVATGENTYEFAAGSGIVVGSDPNLELSEVEAKCRVITS